VGTVLKSNRKIVDNTKLITFHNLLQDIYVKLFRFLNHKTIADIRKVTTNTNNPNINPQLMARDHQITNFR